MGDSLSHLDDLLSQNDVAFERLSTSYRNVFIFFNCTRHVWATTHAFVGFLFNDLNVHRPPVAAIPLRSNAGSLLSRAYSACLRTFENLWRVV